MTVQVRQRHGGPRGRAARLRAGLRGPTAAAGRRRQLRQESRRHQGPRPVPCPAAAPVSQPRGRRQPRATHAGVGRRRFDPVLPQGRQVQRQGANVQVSCGARARRPPVLCEAPQSAGRQARPARLEPIAHVRRGLPSQGAGGHQGGRRRGLEGVERGGAAHRAAGQLHTRVCRAPGALGPAPPPHTHGPHPTQPNDTRASTSAAAPGARRRSR